MARSRSRSKGTGRTPSGLYEAEVLPGLVPFAAAELTGASTRILGTGESSVLFELLGSVRDLLRLRRSVAVHRVVTFDVPRPKALLGHEHLSRLVAAVAEVQRDSPVGFDGFRFGAAGSDSPVFERLASELSRATGLSGRPQEGELLIRFRRGPSGGWEVLLRLTPRPLSARAWRRCNLPGGLNATVAVAANDMLGVRPVDRYLNLMCGSGTLLIERALSSSWQRGVGLDLNPAALECAGENVAAARVESRVELLKGDARSLPFDDGTFDRISADLPWGDAVGRHDSNALLYPQFLREASRVASRNARLLVITHELRLFDEALSAEPAWRRRSMVRVFHGGHRPGLYLLERRR